MIISRKRNTIDFNYAIDGLTLEKVLEIRDLGVIFDINYSLLVILMLK